jgi:hypothetical protein
MLTHPIPVVPSPVLMLHFGKSQGRLSRPRYLSSSAQTPGIPIFIYEELWVYCDKECFHVSQVPSTGRQIYENRPV